MVGSCQHSNELSGYIQCGEFIDYLRNQSLYLLSVRKQLVEHYAFNCPPLLYVSAIFGHYQLRLHKHKWLVYQDTDFPLTVNILKYIKF